MKIIVATRMGSMNVSVLMDNLEMEHWKEGVIDEMSSPRLP